MSRFLLLIVFIAVLQLVGGLLGYLFPADAWYVALDKPFFTPSGQTFGLVWPILYLLIAIAGWRFSSAVARRRAGGSGPCR